MGIGLIINNKLTMNLIVALVSYHLKKGIICYMYDKEIDSFKLIIDNLYYKENNKKYEFSYYYSISDLKILKNNKLVDFN